jgi:hypothetical protein
MMADLETKVVGTNAADTTLESMGYQQGMCGLVLKKSKKCLLLNCSQNLNARLDFWA